MTLAMMDCRHPRRNLISSSQEVKGHMTIFQVSSHVMTAHSFFLLRLRSLLQLLPNHSIMTLDPSSLRSIHQASQLRTALSAFCCGAHGHQRHNSLSLGRDQ